IYVSKIRNDLKNAVGFDYRGWDAAAQFCVTANTHLDEALAWSDKAISGPGGLGVTNFTTLSTKALVLSKMGRDADAKPLMEQAIHLPGTTPQEIHQYGRQLLTAKKTAEAMQVFKYNAERNGEAWPTNVGLARGYSAAGDLPKALDYAKKALAQAPDALNRNSLEGIVKTLSEGQPIAN
ncbi:MAG TPA: tetratricopeptide repeat protein, partial [Bryobacteraceae bacterium]|nr:tetratricopeptide repeat protein [Bryobacteraceae bacterium]